MTQTADPAPSSAPFPGERRALGKIQVHFEFQQALMQRIRLAAARANLSYADYVRKVVGLPYARIQRPRISLSFAAEDLELLAQRYGRAHPEPAALKRCVMEEVAAHLGQSIQAGPSSRPEDGGDG